MYKASLIVSFYKKIDFLRPVIESLINQSEDNFEVIISDDGSPLDIVESVKRLLDEAGLDYQYAWHEDKGWRKNIVLNKSVVMSRADLLIFIDADCVLHKKFIEEHIQMSKPGVVRAGRRVNLSERVSKKIIDGKVSPSYYGTPVLLDLLPDSLMKRAKDVEQGIYVKSKWVRNYLNDRNRSIKGCNFSICKEDVMAVNGFDERFDQPALGEDTDLEARLRRKGLKFRGIRNQAIQYHLFHKQLPRLASRMDLYEENNENNISFTENGIVR